MTTYPLTILTNYDINCNIDIIVLEVTRNVSCIEATVIKPEHSMNGVTQDFEKRFNKGKRLIYLVLKKI